MWKRRHTSTTITYLTLQSRDTVQLRRGIKKISSIAGWFHLRLYLYHLSSHCIKNLGGTEDYFLQFDSRSTLHSNYPVSVLCLLRPALRLNPTTSTSAGSISSINEQDDGERWPWRPLVTRQPYERQIYCKCLRRQHRYYVLLYGHPSQDGRISRMVVTSSTWRYSKWGWTRPWSTMI